jgi:membrane protein implicated in regulation of membrane protease activity
MIGAGPALDVAGIAFIIAAVAMRWRRRDSLTPDALLIAGNVAIGFADIFNGAWQWSILNFATAAVVAWLWWRRRKRRRRARDAIGAKSRALRDALVRRAREAAKPRPVLRPVPGGVR